AQQHLAQILRRPRQENVRLTPILAVRHAQGEAALFHRVKRADGRRLRRADALAELALGKPVLFPERAQEMPHAAADAEGPQALFELALQRAMRPAYLMPDAVLRRIGRAARIAGAAALRARAMGAHRYCAGTAVCSASARSSSATPSRRQSL